MKIIKEFQGVPNGEVYPVTYAPGEDCPPELLEAAISLAAVESQNTANKPAENKVRIKRETKG